jgi:hypothetical protein
LQTIAEPVGQKAPSDRAEPVCAILEKWRNETKTLRSGPIVWLMVQGRMLPVVTTKSREVQLA